MHFKHPSSTRVINTVVLIFGVFTLSAQVILIREFLALAQGSELTVSLVLGFYLTWTAAGSYVSALASRRLKNEFGALVVILFVSGLLLPISLAAVYSVRAFWGLTPVEHIPFTYLMLTAIVLTGPFSFTAGWVFPLAVKILRKGHSLKNGVSLAYILESLGSGIGTLCVTLFLIPRVHSLNLAFILSTMVMGAGAWLYAGFPERKKSFSGVLMVFAILAGAASFSSAPLHWLKQIEWGDMTFLDASISKHGLLEAVSLENQKSIYENGALIATEGFQVHADALVAMTMLQKPNAESVLVIGGAAEGFLRLLAGHSLKRVDMVEQNGALPLFLRKHFTQKRFQAGEFPGSTLIVSDGRQYASRMSAAYDIVILNQPPPASLMVNRFFTREFFMMVRHILKPGGLLVFAMEKSGQYLTRQDLRLLSSIHKTLSGVFPSVDIVPANVCVFFASMNADFKVNEGKTDDPAASILYDSLFGHYNFLPRDVFRAEVSKASAMARENADSWPIAYYYGMLSEMFEYRNPLRTSFEGILSIPPAILFFAPLLLISGFAGLSLARKPSAIGIYPAVFCSGLSAISCQAVLLFCFQTAFGNLYYQIGILFSLFMLGLALGGLLVYTRKTLEVRAAAKGAAFVLLLISLFPLALLMVVTDSRTGPFTHQFFSFACGILTGAGFPMLVLCWVESCQNGRNAGDYSPGKAYALDVLGACTGAMMVGPLLVAILGVPRTCLWLAVINAACLLLFWTASKRMGQAAA